MPLLNSLRKQTCNKLHGNKKNCCTSVCGLFLKWNRFLTDLPLSRVAEFLWKGKRNPSWRCIKRLNSLRVPTWISLDIYTHCTPINFTDLPFFWKTKRIKKRCVTHHLDCVRICEVKTANPTLPGFYSRVLKFSVLSAMADAIPKTANAKQFFNSDANINSLNHWEVQI